MQRLSVFLGVVFQMLDRHALHQIMFYVLKKFKYVLEHLKVLILVILLFFHQEKVLPFFKQAIKEYYGDNPKESNSYARIINAKHFQYKTVYHSNVLNFIKRFISSRRIKNLIDPSKVGHGGNSDEAEKYIEPTIILNADENDKCMQEEIFGPVLPFINVKDHNEAIDFINNRFALDF